MRHGRLTYSDKEASAAGIIWLALVVGLMVWILQGCVSGQYDKTQEFDTAGNVTKETTGVSYRQWWSDTNIAVPTPSGSATFGTTPQSQLPSTMLEAFKAGARSRGMNVDQ